MQFSAKTQYLVIYPNPDKPWIIKIYELIPYQHSKLNFIQKVSINYANTHITLDKKELNIYNYLN